MERTKSSQHLLMPSGLRHLTENSRSFPESLMVWLRSLIKMFWKVLNCEESSVRCRVVCTTWLGGPISQSTFRGGNERLPVSRPDSLQELHSLCPQAVTDSDSKTCASSSRSTTELIRLESSRLRIREGRHFQASRAELTRSRQHLQHFQDWGRAHRKRGSKVCPDCAVECACTNRRQSSSVTGSAGKPRNQFRATESSDGFLQLCTDLSCNRGYVQVGQRVQILGSNWPDELNVGPAIREPTPNLTVALPFWWVNS